jgi:hypothetical protein
VEVSYLDVVENSKFARKKFTGAVVGWRFYALTT